MCEFKALQTDSNGRRGQERERGTERQWDHGPNQEHRTVCLEEFYTFYEVQNLRWTQVRKGRRGGIRKLGRKCREGSRWEEK